MAKKSTCTSNKHSEYSCLIKWGVTSKKFSVDKWCKECVSSHSKAHIVQEYFKEKESKKK